jgi:hypothetical protein
VAASNQTLDRRPKSNLTTESSWKRLRRELTSVKHMPALTLHWVAQHRAAAQAAAILTTTNMEVEDDEDETLSISTALPQLVRPRRFTKARRLEIQVATPYKERPQDRLGSGAASSPTGRKPLLQVALSDPLRLRPNGLRQRSTSPPRKPAPALAHLQLVTRGPGSFLELVAVLPASHRVGATG